MKCSIWDEKSTNCYPNQDQKLKEPEPEKEIFSNPKSVQQMDLKTNQKTSRTASIN